MIAQLIVETLGYCNLALFDAAIDELFDPTTLHAHDMIVVAVRLQLE